MASTLVFKNTVPPQSQTDPAYLAQLATLKDAIQRGSRIHAVMELPENGSISLFYVSDVIIKIAGNYASALIPPRSPINNDAQVTYANGLVAGSFDTLGNYRYGQYMFNGASAPCSNFPGYVISWFAD